MAHASINPNILPTWERAEELADQVLKDSIMHQLFSTQVMDGDLKVKTVSEDNERRQYQIVTSLLSNLRFTSQLLLSPIMRKIASVHVDAVLIGVEELLRDSGFIGETHIHLIAHGVRAYLADDHISALHVLVFQVEGVLRDLLTATGRATFSQEKQVEYRHCTLATLLNVLGQVNGFDTDLSALIRYFLADMIGDNLRNAVGHSLAAPDRFTRENTEIVLMILVRLSLLRVRSQSAPEGEDMTDEARTRASST